MTAVNEILANVFAMDEAQLAEFFAGLSRDALDHLEVLLAKAEKDGSRLKQHLDS